MKSKLYNIILDNITTTEALASVNEYLNNSENKFICFINAHCFNIAQKNKAYFKAIEEADLVLNDGIGIKLASMYYGLKMKENMNGTDLIPKILELSAKIGKGVFLLGSEPGICEKAKQNLENKISNINICGYHHGFFNIEKAEDVIKKINDSKAEILVVGMGVPNQELFINKYKNKLNTVKVSIAGGAIIDFQAGKVSRAPRLIRKLNLEWLYRFYLEPKRMFSRYFIGGFNFFFIVFKGRFIKPKG